LYHYIPYKIHLPCTSKLQQKDRGHVKKWKKGSPKNLLGSKITYEYIWREREADEGSKYFLHAVPIGYTHGAHDYVGTMCGTLQTATK